MSRRYDEVLLESMINGAWLNKTKGPEYVPSVRRIGMSGMANCPRLLYFNVHRPTHLLGIQLEIPEFIVGSKLSKIFDDGNEVEDRFVERLKKQYNNIIDTQRTFYDLGGRLKGKLDGSLFGYPIEIKGLNDRKYQKFVSEGMMYLEPNYQYQLDLYIYHFRSGHGYFLVKNKNTTDIRVQRVDLDIDRVALIREKARNAIESKHIIDVKVIRDDYSHICDNCLMKDVCDKLPDSTIKRSQKTQYIGLYKPY